MREALDLARQGRAQASPNPMVGAVVVRDGEVVGRGFHTYAGMQHAEIIALEEAGERARGATLYVNLEPCSHQGRTPPVRRCADRGRRGAGGGGHARIRIRWWRARAFDKLRDAGIEVEIAAEFTAEAEKLNEAFVHFMRTGRPLVTLKTAHHAGRQDLRAGRQSRLDHQRARPRPRAGTAARSRRHPDRHRHGAGRRLPADRPHRPAALPPAAAHRDGFAAAPAARFEDGAQRRGRRGGGDDLRVLAGAAQDRWKRRGVEVLVFDGPGGRADLRERGASGWAGSSISR